MPSSPDGRPIRRGYTLLELLVVQAVILDGRDGVTALQSSFRFAATYAGETFVIILATLVVSFAFSFIPYVGWLLMIPTTAYFAALSTLFYASRET
jgi:hypothetical protein